MNDHPDFTSFGLSEASLSAIRNKGFEIPTPIQSKIIPELLHGTGDLIGQAQTGTGKTAAFSIPLLELAQEGMRVPQALILAPTRELSMQIAQDVNSLKGDRDIAAAAFYGGEPIEYQLRKLRDGMDIVIGTPGRILDLIRREKLDLSNLDFAILDEADEMLDMGFIDDIRSILEATNPEKRTLLFSATIPPDVLDIAAQFMHDFQIIRTETPELGDGLTDQIYFLVRKEDRLDALVRIIEMEESFFGLIFCRTKFDVDELTADLKSHGINAEALHGDIAQTQRTRVIARFKAKKFRILVATDVAARGIDVADLTHVVNYALPEDPESYIHRIGRTGRAGKSGTAITFVAPSETRRLAFIEKKANTKLRKGVLPVGADIVEVKKQRFLDSVNALLERSVRPEYLEIADQLAVQYPDVIELLAAVLQLKFHKELLESEYPVLDAPEFQDRGRRGPGGKAFHRAGRPSFRKPRYDDEEHGRPFHRNKDDSFDRPRRWKKNDFQDHRKGSPSRGFHDQNSRPVRQPHPGRKKRD